MYTLRLSLVTLFALLPAAPARGDEKLPEGAVARLGSLRFRDPAGVSAGALSPDGKLLALGGNKGSIVLWDTASGKKLHTISGDSRAVTSLSFSPDSKRLAIARQAHHVRVVAALDGKELHALTGLLYWVESLAFSPDGRRLALGTDRHTVHVWEPGGADPLTLTGHGAPVCSVAFSPDGRALASAANDRSVRVWDLAAGKQRLKIDHNENVLGVAFSPDGAVIAGAGTGAVRLWDARSGKPAGGLTANEEQVLAVAYAPGGKALAAAVPGGVRLWDMAARKPLRTLPQTMPVHGIAFSADGRLMMTRSAFAARLWDPATGAERLPLEGHEGPIHHVAFSPDGKSVATAGADHTVRLWDLGSGREQWRRAHKDEVWHVAVADAPGGWLLASLGLDREARLWDGAGKELLRLAAAGNHTSTVAFAPDGRTLAVPQPRSEVALIDPATGEERRRLSYEAGNVVAFTPSGRALATGGGTPTGGGVRLWDAQTGDWFWKEKWEGTGLCFAANGRLLCVSERRKGIRLLETATGRTRAWYRDAGSVRACFAPDGRTLAVVSESGEGPVRLLSVATGKELRRLPIGPARVLTAGFAPAPVAFGKAAAPPRTLLASAGDDGTVLLWDVTGAGRAPARKPGTNELAGAWRELASEDATSAHEAIWVLAECGTEAAEFVGAMLRPVKALDPKELARFIAELDDKRYTVREQAQESLTRAGEAVAPALRKVLEGKPTLEMKRRAEILLERIEGKIAEREWERYLRALEALELSGTAEARRVLERLAGGVRAARRTEEAAAALKRLKAAAPAR